MRRGWLIAAALVAATTLAEPAVYRVDGDRTRAEFEIGHFGVMHTKGRFVQLTGRLAFDPAARAASIMLDLPAASVDTGWEARDDFGMSALWPMLSDDVELMFRIYAVRD